MNTTEPRPVRRWMLTAGGLLFFAIAIVGVWLPGIPTTGPLILASMLLGKANPELRERILAIGVLKPYRGYVDGSKEFTRGLRCWALLCMWISISLSCGIIYATAGEGSLALPMCLLGGVIGSIVIVFYQRRPYRTPQTLDVAATETKDITSARRRIDPTARATAWLSRRATRAEGRRFESVPH